MFLGQPGPRSQRSSVSKHSYDECSITPLMTLYITLPNKLMATSKKIFKHVLKCIVFFTAFSGTCQLMSEDCLANFSNPDWIEMKRDRPVLFIVWSTARNRASTAIAWGGWARKCSRLLATQLFFFIHFFNRKYLIRWYRNPFPWCLRPPV